VDTQLVAPSKRLQMHRNSKMLDAQLGEGNAYRLRSRTDAAEAMGAGVCVCVYVCVCVCAVNPVPAS